MDEPRHLGRYLGATLLVVFVGSVLSEALTLSLFSDSTADTLNNIADNTALLRWATVMELCITSVGIVVLAALLYATVKDQNPLLATLAFGCTIAEATILAVSTLGAFLLVPLSEDYAEAGSSSLELIAVADTLRNIDRFGWEVHHVFFGVAGVLWYTLMYQSRRIPRWLSVWGIVAVGVAGSSSILLLGTGIDLFFLAFPTGLFELVLGLWLVTKGLAPSETPPEPGW
ncbi:MAG: DUF4386 domain-containing protein [Acidimicrobiia bacterium]|nr:DUF4386 domain-containing protein [Acidimicrobiia bacterium]